MKLLYTAALAILFHYNSSATTWPVAVSNFQFSPATVNAVIGDVIQFNWSAGTHTTTCGAELPGTTLPAGAAEWDAAITSGATTFSYTITVAGTYNYGCTPHFAFNMKGTIIASGTLPVKFGSFTVSNEKNIALLQWQTFSEANTRYFSIRKSTDGTNFTEIGKVNAAGNSSNTIKYTFPDNDMGGIYKYLYYEIVTVDADKKESFSVIKTLRNNNILKDNLIVALTPNPVTRPGQVQLKFNADKNGEMDVSVFSSTGQLVLKTTMAAFYGLNSGHLHICDLEKGTYNIVFNLAGKKEIKKVVVL
ncbi:MAG: plastocyanin/azurin family copper-binding protein [Ferruginibacter sp.]